MSRRKGKRNPLIDSDAATIRLLCDEASNHMKVRNYTKALTTYNQEMPNPRDILGTDKESEFLQSFVRIEINEEEYEEPKQSIYSLQKSTKGLIKQSSELKSESSEKAPRRASFNFKTSPALDPPNKQRRRKPREFFDEVYTDKDRAAAVSIGAYDIKQSLSLKRRKDRNEALQLPEEADAGSLLALGMREFKNGNIDIAVSFITKALELNANDQNALVARSKCYLLLGEPAKALQDSETALLADKNHIRAIYQKAEALYFLGQFEHSLMFFHRGLRLRPELASFRLGIQKTQEAIQNTIGAAPSKPKKSSANKIEMEKSREKLSNLNLIPRAKSSKVDAEKKQSRRLLGELYVDLEYLENLLKHPDLKRADSDSEHISLHAKEAVTYLNTRQEFWRQQRPPTSIATQKKVVTRNTPFV